jgi:hypothetical protein
MAFSFLLPIFCPAGSEIELMFLATDMLFIYITQLMRMQLNNPSSAAFPNSH